MAYGNIKVKVEINEEFIERIKELYEDGMLCAYASGYRAGLKDAAKDLPSVIPQVPSEDCISRVRVLRYIADVQLTVSDDKKQRAVCDWLFDGIEEMPSVIPSADNLSAVGEGEWIEREDWISETNLV